MNMTTSGCVAGHGTTPHVVAWVANQNGNQEPGVAGPRTETVHRQEQPGSHGLGQRLAEVRQREGITRRALARRLGVPVRKVAEQEHSDDVLLSELQQWQKAIGVPLCELLNDLEGVFASPIQLRAKMLLVMKTVRSIQQRAKQTPVQRLAETLAEQLIEMMPELKEVAAWPSVGHQRKKRDFGQAFYRGLAFDASFDDAEGPEQ